jgi:hypothetical protein
MADERCEWNPLPIPFRWTDIIETKKSAYCIPQSPLRNPKLKAIPFQFL